MSDPMQNDRKYQCKLCGQFFTEKEISDEHYPARSVGNNDIVQVDLMKVLDFTMSEKYRNAVLKESRNGTPIDEILGSVFDTKLSSPMYPKGRTAQTLCRDCNTFLGRYDADYLKFFELDGDCKKTRGFQQATKLRVIKSIFGKFLSVPEAEAEDFDFIEFVRNDSMIEYKGKWNLYFVRRDSSADLLGLKDISTGVANYSEGVVYELSDDKFIFDLLNFPKHSQREMTNIFDILNKDYHIVDGVGEDGGYHADIVIPRLLGGFGELPME